MRLQDRYSFVKLINDLSLICLSLLFVVCQSFLLRLIVMSTY